MKNRILLTSLVAIFAAGPALAVNITGSGNECNETALGTATGPATVTAKWAGNKSGAITIDSKYYATASTETGTNVTKSATPTPVYTVYGNGTTADSNGNTGGVYSAAPTTNDTSKITQLTQNPTYTGYTWGGFYTEKTGTGTQVVDTSGNFTAATRTLYPTTGATATWYAKWTPNTSGAITLDSKYYATSGTATGTAVTTNAAPTPVYTVYKTSVHSATPVSDSNKITALSTLPSYTGYSFGGFYTARAGTGTQVIDNTGTFLTASKSQVSSSGGTKTWYAKWTPNDYTVSFNCGTGATIIQFRLIAELAPQAHRALQVWT